MTLSVDIRKQLGDFQLEAQFQAEEEALALLGASGSGKSITLRCIAGILRPDEGVIRLDGETLFDSAARIDLPPQRRNVGYLFQQYALFPNMTAAQNIAAAVRDRQNAPAVTADLLRRFRLEEAAALRPRQLSGGQQQRCALARILASSPKAILLDEPFAGIDPIAVADIQGMIAHLAKRGIGILITDHNVRETLSIVDKAYILADGKILLHGDSHTIAHDPVARKYYLGDNFSM